MAIFVPEKLIAAAIGSGMTTIKADLDQYVPDIFAADELGDGFVSTVKTYLAAHSVKVSQGYPLTDLHTPGWFVVPASSQTAETFIGEYGADDSPEELEVEGAEEGETEMETFGPERSVRINRYSVRVISASENADVTLMLSAVCRYILLSAIESLTESNFHEVDLSTMDLDPIYQFLPQNLNYQTTMLNFKGFDCWVKRYNLIQDVKLFGKFNDNESYIEIP